MSRTIMPTIGVGNDFVVPQPRLRVATPVATPEPAAFNPVVIEVAVAPSRDFTPSVTVTQTRTRPFERIMDLVHRYSLATFALLFLLVGTTGIQVGNRYWTAHITAASQAAAEAIPKPARTIAGLNIVVPRDQLQAKLQTIANQPATITVGTQAVPISPDTVKSWLQIGPTTDKSKASIHIKADAIEASLTAAANKFVKAPVDQVTATYADGSSAVIIGGTDGVKLTDPAGLKQQASAIAKTVMDGKGMQFNAPLSAQAFAAVTPAAFNKLIEVNVVTKQMYLYDNGQLTHTYPISAGAPATPTPLGEFHIFSKLTVQDMKGFNPNGTPYFQPHVHWINYFLPGGYAVHGNYWRPASVFGSVNSSHGCVSLPDTQAKEVYDWAPLGTTVITHA